MVIRHFTRVFVALAFVAVAMAQEPAQQEEPRVHIKIDVTATVPDDEHWLEIQSRNFVVAGTAREDELKKVAADFELMRETLAGFFPRIRSGSAVPTTILVFQNTPSFRWYRPANDDFSLDVKGYVQPSSDKNYIVMSQGTVPREVYRDYLRLLIPEAMPPVPLWLREGLADYFSNLKVNRYLLGKDRWTRLGTGIVEYDGLLDKKAKLLSFDKVFSVHEDSPEYRNPEKRALFLAESWGVVHYLMSRGSGISAMQRLLNMLGEGEPFDSAVVKVVGRSTGAFESDFRTYIRFAQSEHQWLGALQLLTKSKSQVDKGLCGKMILVGINVPRTRRIIDCYTPGEDPDPPGIFRIPYAFDETWAAVSPLSARTLSEAEAWFYRGDLMLHIGRLGEADAYLRRSAQQPPQVSRAYASLGLLQIQQKRYPESADSLNTAVQLDSRNHLAHYYKAILARLRGLQNDTVLSYDDVEDIHDELVTVVALAPQFVEASEMLAGINLVRKTAFNESQKVLVEALRRYPGRSTSWITLANVTFRGGDVAGTRWLLARLLVAAPESDIRKDATILLNALAPASGARPVAGAPVTGGAQQSGTTLVAGSSQPKARSADKTSSQKLRGVLTQIECRNGLTFIVKSGGKVVKLHTTHPFSVEVIARDRDGRAIASEPVACGPAVDEGVDVTITYRSSKSGDSIGEPLVVDIHVEDD